MRTLPKIDREVLEATILILRDELYRARDMLETAHQKKPFGWERDLASSIHGILCSTSESGANLREGMKCPYCGKRIDDATLASHLGSKGGSRSKRKITREQQHKMQKARKAKNRKA